MRIKRIIAGLLSFILVLGNPVAVLANAPDIALEAGSEDGADTVSQNEMVVESDEQTVSESNVSEEESVSENVMPKEESVSENNMPQEESISENAVTVSDNSVIEELPLPDWNAEQETVADLPFEYVEITAEAQTDLQSYLDEKDIFALVYLTNSYEVKSEPSVEADTILSVPSAKTVQILGMEVEWNYSQEWEEYIPTVWYETQFYEGETLYSGYIEDSYLAYSDELLLQWKNNWFMLFPASVSLYATTDSYADVNQFPTSYRSALRALKDAHPNWTFVPMNVNRSWDDCVTEQLGNYSWIYYNQPSEYRDGKINSTWHYASRAGIEYYMDPRNFLTEANIFQFEQNTYNSSYHTVEALQAFLNNTFMKGKVPEDPSGRTYAQVIFNSGKSRGLSPFNLAARVIQEQGVNGTSAMISGTYSGYEGYYNHYNISASGTTNEEVFRNGLSYAKSKGWNTRTKSLEGGAAFIGNGYILQGQDTLYLQKFDIEHGSSSLHQYMQNIMAPYTEGRSMKTMYTNAGSLNSAFVFKIPVFNNMPNEYKFTLSKSKVTLVRGKTESYTLIVKCNGSAAEAGTVTFTSENGAVATVSSTGVITAVGSGETIIHATVKYKDMDEAVELTCKVTVLSPLQDISLNIEKQELFFGDDLPEEVAYLDENGVTQYKYASKGQLPTQVTLEVSYDPIDTTDSRKVTWTVEDEEVISLEEQGDNSEQAVITAKNSGTTKVTAKVGKITKTAEITVRIPMTQASLKQNELTLYKGQTTQITASYAPYNTTDRIEPVWTSENEAVAVVEDGRIIAKGAGTTKLRAAIGPFDGTQSELTVDVTVEEYEVTFMNADGTELLKVPGEYRKPLENLVTEGEVELPWTLEKEGHYFIGWYTGENGSGNLVTQNTILYADMVLYPYFVAAESSEPYVKPIGSVTYTGAYIKPDVKVYNENVLLKKGVDYTLSYKNNKAVNDGSDPEKLPTIIITGKGQYEGWNATQTFIIAPKNITHVDITAKNLSVDYNGKVQKLRPAVSDSGRTLQYNKDYTLEYPDTADGAYKEAGTYAVKITGIGNYTGERTVYITITKRVMMEDVTVSVASEVKYNNGKSYTSAEELEACRPPVTVKHNGNTLIENKDYILVYSNNENIGTASVTVVGQGAYIGSRTLYFKIVGTQMSTVTIAGISDKEYTGEAITQSSLVVTDKSKNVLQEGLDYKITYKNNIKTGRASVIFTGIHGYAGSVTKTFTIEPYDISTNSLTYEADALDGSGMETRPAFEAELLTEEMEYDKAGVKPGVTVTFKGEALKEGTDYKVSYENNYRVSGENAEKPPTVVITGKGLYTGSVTKNFAITAKDIAKVTMTAKDVKFRNRQGFCFVEPVLTDGSGRRLKAGTDYEKELIYTYATDVVLYDGTVRLEGEVVLETDIPTPGELNDAKITVSAKGIGNYTGMISASYAILQNTSWLEDLFITEEVPELRLNRSVLYLDPIYPEASDSIKLGVENGTLLPEKTTVVYKPADGNADEGIADLFDVVLEEGKLTLKLNKSRDELADVLPDGNYVFAITPVVEIEGEEITLAERTVTVRISRNAPEVVLQQSGSIDLLFRETSAVEAAIQLVSQVDSLIIPANQSELDTVYYLSGSDAFNYRLVYEDSTFTDKYNVKLSIQAVENSCYDGTTDIGSEQLVPGETSDLTLCFETASGVELKQVLQIVPTQSEYVVTPYTSTCYIKKEDGRGQIIFTSSLPITYENVSCDKENVTVSVSGRKLSFVLDNSVDYADGDRIPITVSMYAKGAGKGTAPQTFGITLLICEETELEKLVATKDTTEKTLTQRQEEMTSYEETKEVNTYDKKVIAANTVDFSDVSIAFLGDSITAGVGLEKIGIEENVYTSVVKRALNPKAVYQLGFGGKSISRYWDSLLEEYEKIPLDTDIIFVLAGMNDVYSGKAGNFGSLAELSQSKTFCGDTYELMSSLQSRYPQAQIIFLTPLSSVTNESYKSFLPDMLPMVQYVSAIKAIGAREELTNVEVWDLYNANLLDSYDSNILSEYMYDGVHPGVAGHRVLGEHIASELIRMKMGE